MLRRGVCFLVILGLLAGQLATIPHAHAGLSKDEQRKHDATPHVHCVASSHATRDHSHADHARHGATPHGDAHHGESGHGDTGHDHGHAGREHRHRHDVGASSDRAPAGEATRGEAPRSESPSEETPSEETPSEETPCEDAPSEETPGEEAPSDAFPHDGTAVFLAVNTTLTSVGAGWDDECESFAAPTSLAICQTLDEPTLIPSLAERHRPPDKFVGGSNIYLALRNLRI